MTETIHHSNTIREYNISKNKLNDYRKKGMAQCRNCGKPIELGDRIVAKYKPKCQNKLYCIECAKKLSDKN